MKAKEKKIIPKKYICDSNTSSKISDIQTQSKYLDLLNQQKFTKEVYHAIRRQYQTT